jgi:hypothetical protein
MRTLSRTAGTVLGIAAMAVLVIAANTPITVHDSEQGILRLAWSVRPERIERCRRQSEEELARLPAHMRQPVICEGASAEYRLTVLHDGAVAAERVVRGGGFRHDRRVYVFHELPLDPGDATIEVRFDRIDLDTPRMSLPEAGHDGRKEAHRAEAGETDRGVLQAAGETVPPQLRFTQRLRVRPREVILVTYSPERRALAGVRGDYESR